MFQQIVRNRAIAAVSVACAAGAATVSYKSFQMDTAPAYADSKKPKLVYFNAPGRAFVIRAALRHAKVPFEDVRLSFPELVHARGPTGANQKIPLGQLPTLELPTGEVLCQSIPILRWASRQSDLYPSDINKALVCDEVCESLNEMRSKLPESKDDAERKKLREEYIAHTMPKYMEYLTRRIEQHGGPFILGKQFSMADLVVARFVDGVVEKKFDHLSRETLEKWPAILKHFNATRAHPIYVNEVRAEEELQKQAKGKAH